MFDHLAYGICIMIGLVLGGSALGVGLQKGLSELANAIKERPKTSLATNSPTQHFSGEETTETKKQKHKVAELSPEFIAPNLKKPPRPPGGFGTRDRK